MLFCVKMKRYDEWLSTLYAFCLWVNVMLAAGSACTSSPHTSIAKMRSSFSCELIMYYLLSVTDVDAS